MTHNGWTNWDTWEAFNIISSDEDTYTAAIDMASVTTENEHLRYYVKEAMDCLNIARKHINFKTINWNELRNHLKAGV